MKSCAQPKGQGQSLRAMDTRWDTQWVSGYLQVGADSPQDIIDTVTRDEGHEDVLQEKEMSCWERFPHPESSSPQAGTGRDIMPLNLPVFRSHVSPTGISLRSFPAVIFAAC